MEKKQSDLSQYQPGTHNILIEDRRRIRITGVLDVESFQEDEATVLTQAGPLTVWGEQLKLGKLDPESGQVVLEGELFSLEYEQPAPERKLPFFRRK